MLGALSIRNIVLIDHLDMDMGAGFSVLTGETGAGKSILLDSLALVLGQRADNDLIRKGQDKAVVTAEFHPPFSSNMMAMIQEADIEVSADNTLIIRRSLVRDGASRAFINDQPVGVTTLKKIGSFLVDIHSQFETHTMLDPKSHRQWLDQFMARPDLLDAIRNSYDAWKEAQEALDQAQADLEKAAEDQEFWAGSLEILEQLDPKEGEEDSLVQLRAEVAAKEQVMEKLGLAIGMMEGEDAAIQKANLAWKALDRSPVRDEQALETLDQSISLMQDVATGLQDRMQDLMQQDQSVESIDDRLIALRSEARKHQCSCDELVGVMHDLSQRLANVREGDTQTARLQARRDEALAQYQKAADALSQARQEAAKKLSEAIQQELAPLKLANARFVVDISQDGERPGADGQDGILFTLAANAGQSPAPLHKCASGGELSRIMLAMKMVFAKVNPVGTMIFDEIDSGMGGAAADAVGGKLSALSTHCQVMAITHAPQIAAMGDAHFVVAKTDADGVTTTSVTPLPGLEDRREEIARMLSGAQITDQARQAAAALMGRDRDVA